MVFVVFDCCIFQCENGHPACSVCCEKISRCPSCSQPTGRIRNRAFEEVIESLQVECKHAGHGCNTMVKYTEKANHEKDLCEYRPVLCPVIRLMLDFSGGDCTYIGPQASISGHLADAHGVRIVECSGSMMSTTFIMKDSEDEIVMIKAKEAWLLVGWLENFQGDAFHCDSVLTSKEVAYKLTVKPIKLNRKSNKVYSMEAVAHGEIGAASTWGENFLLVPGGCKEHEVTLSFI